MYGHSRRRFAPLEISVVDKMGHRYVAPFCGTYLFGWHVEARQKESRYITRGGDYARVLFDQVRGSMGQSLCRDCRLRGIVQLELGELRVVGSE